MTARIKEHIHSRTGQVPVVADTVVVVVGAGPAGVTAAAECEDSAWMMKLLAFARENSQ